MLAERLGQSWVNDLRVTVFEQVARTPVREHRRSTGATAMRFVGDMTAMRRWAALGLAKLAVGVPMVVGCLVALALASPLIAGAVGTVVLIGFVSIRLVTPQLYQTNRAARRRRAQVAAHVTEHVGNRLVMQAFGREDAERRLLGQRGRRLGHAMVRRAEMIGAVRAIGEATTLLAGVAALAAALVARVDPAAAAAALAVVGILIAPLRDLSRVAEYRASAAVALEKLNGTMARPVRPRPAVTVELPAGPGRLELEGVALHGVLDGISAVVPAGSVVALVGGNGSGKTTLLTVLSGLVAPDAGRVLLDGVDLRSLDEGGLRRAIGFAGPDLPLLLDEADAHLDSAAGRVVDRLLAEFAGTVVVVTHRLEQLPGARTVWRLANGRIRVEPAGDPEGVAR